jgi:hypothetical protein
VKGIAQQDECAPLLAVNLAGRVVAVAPDDELFQHEEGDDAGQHRAGNRQGRIVLQGLWQHAQEGCSQQGAGGVGQQARQQARAHRIGEGQQKGRARHGPDTAQKTEDEGPQHAGSRPFNQVYGRRKRTSW